MGRTAPSLSYIFFCSYISGGGKHHSLTQVGSKYLLYMNGVYSVVACLTLENYTIYREEDLCEGERRKGF